MIDRDAAEYSRLHLCLHKCRFRNLQINIRISNVLSSKIWCRITVLIYCVPGAHNYVLHTCLQVDSVGNVLHLRLEQRNDMSRTTRSCSSIMSAWTWLRNAGKTGPATFSSSRFLVSIHGLQVLTIVLNRFRFVIIMSAAGKAVNPPNTLLTDVVGIKAGDGTNLSHFLLKILVLIKIYKIKWDWLAHSVILIPTTSFIYAGVTELYGYRAHRTQYRALRHRHKCKIRYAGYCRKQRATVLDHKDAWDHNTYNLDVSQSICWVSQSWKKMTVRSIPKCWHKSQLVKDWDFSPGLHAMGDIKALYV